ncbi:hypothetical protein M3691_18895 [Paenibacillus elgii]|nr:hypothetical protein [Paenibacillus elgii]MCM3270863.1 hypothetical protein [Paenibacillus elgii]
MKSDFNSLMSNGKALSMDLKIPVLIGIDDGKNISVWCPFCRKFHFYFHGSVGGEGHRVAHCNSESPFRNSGYYIKIAFTVGG